MSGGLFPGGLCSFPSLACLLYSSIVTPLILLAGVVSIRSMVSIASRSTPVASWVRRSSIFVEAGSRRPLIKTPFSIPRCSTAALWRQIASRMREGRKLENQGGYYL